MFIYLVNNGYYYEEAVCAAKRAFDHDDRFVAEISIKLFKALILKGKAILVATEFAKKGLNDKNEEVVRLSKKLLKRISFIID